LSEKLEVVSGKDGFQLDAIRRARRCGGGPFDGKHSCQRRK